MPAMKDVEKLKEQIAKTEKILAEAKENYDKNPEEYSAQLLLLSTENYLNDLLQQLDFLMLQNKDWSVCKDS